jgi:hypothetical protein
MALVGTRVLRDTHNGIDLIVTGAFTVAHFGNPDNYYMVDITYEDDQGRSVKTERVPVPRFRIEVRDPATGAVRREIAGQLPPRDEPLRIDTGSMGEQGAVETDPSAFIDIDPRTPLTVRFSEPLDIHSIADHLKLLRADGTQAPGDWIVTPDGREATFRSIGGLRLATTYRIFISGVQTASGGNLPPRTIPVTTFIPRRVGMVSLEPAGPAAPMRSVEDLAFWRRRVGETEQTLVHVLTSNSAAPANNQGPGLHIVDAGDPHAPRVVSNTYAGFHTRRISLLPDVTLPLRSLSDNELRGNCMAHVYRGANGSEFRGDLAVTTTWNLFQSSIGLFDVTEAAQPCVVGSKTITANPDQLTPATTGGTFAIVAYPKGLTSIRHERGAAAYMAAAQGGMFGIDIGSNLPAVAPAARQREGFYSGDYHDVVSLGSRLLAFNGNYDAAPSLDVFDPNLGLITSVPINDGGQTRQRAAVGRVAVSLGVSIDVDATKSVARQVDLAFVGSSGGVSIFDISNHDQPLDIGRVPMRAPVYRMTVAQDGRTLYISSPSESTGGGQSLFIVDVSDPFQTPIDSDQDGVDDRIVYEIPFGTADVDKTIGAISADLPRGLLYVGTGHAFVGQAAEPAHVEVWAVTRGGAAALNRPPRAEAGPDQFVKPGSTVLLDGGASSDADHDVLSFHWTVRSGPSVKLTDSRSVRSSFVVPADAPHGSTWVIQLTVSDGIATSEPDTVTIRVQDPPKLTLRPALVPFIVENSMRQLVVELTKDDQQFDVTADPDTTYQWIAGTSAIPELDSFLRPIWSALAAKFKLPEVPVRIAELTVTANGQLTAKSKGVNIVRAIHKGIVSNVSVVLVGIELKDIELEPQSLFTAAAGEMMKNPPLIVTSKGNGLGEGKAFLSDRGAVLLTDAKFEFLGSSIHASVSDLVGALRPALEGALTAELGGNAPVARFLVKALGKLAGFAAAQVLDPFGPEKKEIVAPLMSDDSLLKGLFQGQAPGTTNIKGTLSLGPLGEASDTVLAIVLPNITSVELEPHEVWLNANGPREPGEAIRSFVRATIAKSTHEIEVLKKEIPAAEDDMSSAARWVLGKVVPKISADVNGAVEIDKRLAFFYGFRIRFATKVDASCTVADAKKVTCTIQFSDMEVGFHAPVTAAPFINVEYSGDRPELFELTRDGAPSEFDTMVRHNNRCGVSSLVSKVSIPPFGSATDPTGRVIVVCTDRPYVRKEMLGASGPVMPGQSRTYRIAFANPTSASLSGVVVRDELSLNDKQISVREMSLGTVEAHQSRVVDVDITVPSQSGLLVNTVTCVSPTCTPPVIASVERVIVAHPVINEVVTEPKQDWNADGVTDAGDQWIEIMTNSGSEELRGCRIEYTDETGVGRTIDIDPDDPRIIVGTDMRHVTVTGLSVPMAIHSVVRLRSGQAGEAVLVDEVEIAGSATSPDDEAFARIPDALDRDSVADFRRQAATKGKPNQ